MEVINILIIFSYQVKVIKNFIASLKSCKNPVNNTKFDLHIMRLNDIKEE